VVDMFMRDAEPAHEVQPVHYRSLDFTVGFSALGVLALGIVPGMVITAVQAAAQWFMSGVQ
jgi:NADH:ubiquinone oxidoreductase subunit 2 (subunit N)